MSMVTDTQRPRRTDPGEPDRCVAFTLHRLYTPEDEQARIVKECRGAEIGCVDCKKILAGNVVKELAPFREKRAELASQPELVRQILEEGNLHASTEAAKTMLEVRKAIKL